jgi:hypothetical protein
VTSFFGCRHRTHESDAFALGREPIVQPAFEIWFRFRDRNSGEGHQALSAKTVQVPEVTMRALQQHRERATSA